jgi:adhesin/invasin
VSASPTSTTATGASVSAITVQLRDANNNPTNVGGPPTLSHSGVGTLSAVAAQGGGVYTASLTSVAAGAAVVTASVGGQQIPGSPVTVTFVPDVLARLDRVTPDPTTGVVAGQSTLLTVRAVDAQGNPIAGVTIDFTATAGGGSLSPASANTDLSGLASATLTTGTTVGTNTVTAAVRSNPAISTTFTVGTAPGAATALLKVTVDPSTVVAGSTTTLTVRAVDVNGNPRPGVTVSFSADNGGAVTTPTTTDAQGLASTSLTTSTSVGVTHTVTATASGANVVGSPATSFAVTTTVAAAVARLAAPAPAAATPAAPRRR